MKYDHKQIEKKWRLEWEKNKIYTTPDKAPGKDNFYLLVEFPYPSGNLHVGHWYAFAVPDILARAKRMQGMNVMYPIGFDAFGLPAENAAIKNGINPRKWTYSNIEYMVGQIESMGTSFDWSRKVITADPEYYKWTQWLFLQLHKKGLVYQKETAVNWCPKDKTVLANEQVVDGKCERCESEVEQRQMLQWNIKITDYADRLIDDLADLDWPEQIKASQRNWIGRSEGAEIDFALEFEKKDGPKPNFLLLHGFTGRADKNFIPKLKADLEARGFDVQAPQMPNTDTPKESEQVPYVLENCTIDERTIIVGHSLGCVVGMKVLEEINRPVAGLVLVAPAVEPEYRTGDERPFWSTFDWKYDYERIKKLAGFRLLLSDTLEKAKRGSYIQYLSEKISAPVKEVEAKREHFTGDDEPFILANLLPNITVFTTRPDTLFGATYLVLAPEHPWVTLALGHKTVLKNNDEVQKYITATQKKTELERVQDQKDKTGVRLEGVEAINPATGEKIPLYVADYVLGHYGTGAIMAVPAHDERDYEFAKKFDLPIRPVVEPKFVATHEETKLKPDQDIIKRDAICAVIRNPKNDTYLCNVWKDIEMRGLLTGGIEEGEDLVAAATREIQEETGYKNVALVPTPERVINVLFYQRQKKQNRWARFHILFFDLVNEEREEPNQEELAKHEFVWKKKEELKNFFTVFEGEYVVSLLDKPDYVFTGQGLLANSGQFDTLDSQEAKEKITETFGRAKKTYKLRDWIVSRQRYWGVPIPMIHCEKCGSQPVADENLPVVLPEVEDYLPSGEGKSPLAKVDSFVNVACPKCGAAARRETDTLDTFVDSSWYYLRYTDPKNTAEFASREIQDNWMPIDLYSGGAEHTTMHVLYSRFWHKALFDIGLVKDAEPYTRRMNRSLILGPDGQKMSKSRGNVIDPDTVVDMLGSDTVRMYLAFIGPYNEVSSYPWNPDGVVGVRRFLERISKAEEYVQPDIVPSLEPILHKTTKKVTEDIEAMKFNTAISQLMITLNAIEKEKKIGRVQWSRMLTLLAPFAPHLAEELWSMLDNTNSVHAQVWPKYDALQLVSEDVMIAIQINGKVRGEVMLPFATPQEEVEAAAKKAVESRLEGQEIIRTIVVPNRLVNFVVKA